MKSFEAVTYLAKYLAKHVEVPVYIYKKDPTLKDKPYLCLNSLQFNYDKWISRNNIINVNVHYPSLSNGIPNTEELNGLVEDVTALIPMKNATTEDDDKVLMIKEFMYEIETDSNCMEDTDNTFFVNIRVSVTF